MEHTDRQLRSPSFPANSAGVPVEQRLTACEGAAVQHPDYGLEYKPRKQLAAVKRVFAKAFGIHVCSTCSSLYGPGADSERPVPSSDHLRDQYNPSDYNVGRQFNSTQSIAIYSDVNKGSG